MRQEKHKRWLVIAISIVALVGAAFSLRAQTLIPPQVSIPLNYFGMHFHRLDNRGTTWPSAGCASAPAIRVGSVRLSDADVTWRDLQPAQGTWNWSHLDNLVSEAQLHCAEILLTLVGTPRWAASAPDQPGGYGPGSASMPANDQYWTDFVRAVATRYRGRIRWYEIWNEPGVPGFFSGTPAEYLRLVRLAKSTLATVDSNAKLLAPAIIGIGELRAFLGATEPGSTQRVGNYADAISYHFYAPSNKPETGFLNNISLAKGVLNEFGLGAKPIWNTEFGYLIKNTDGTAFTSDIDQTWMQLDQTRSAAWVARSLILGWASGLPRFFWYSWDNYNMGFIEPSSDVPGKVNVVKKAGIAYGATVNWMTGQKMLDCVKSAALWTCRLQASNGAVSRILWSDNETAQRVSIPLTWRATTVQTLDGVTTRLALIGASVNVDGSPVLVK